MTKIKLNSIFVIFSGLALFFILGNACNKNKECKASILVLDSTGVKPQPDVVIKLYATVQTNGGTQVADLKAEGTTDVNGKVFFTFKLPSILDIEAKKINCVLIPGKQWCSGKGIIKLEEGKTTDKTIYLKQ